MPKGKEEQSDIRCTECDSLVAKVERGALVIESKHHGAKHRTVIGLDWLKRLIEEPDSNLTIASDPAKAG